MVFILKGQVEVLHSFAMINKGSFVLLAWASIKKFNFSEYFLVVLLNWEIFNVIKRKMFLTVFEKKCRALLLLLSSWKPKILTLGL